MACGAWIHSPGRSHSKMRPQQLPAEHVVVGLEIGPERGHVDLELEIDGRDGRQVLEPDPARPGARKGTTPRPSSRGAGRPIPRSRPRGSRGATRSAPRNRGGRTGWPGILRIRSATSATRDSGTVALGKYVAPMSSRNNRSAMATGSFEDQGRLRMRTTAAFAVEVLVAVFDGVPDPLVQHREPEMAAWTRNGARCPPRRMRRRHPHAARHRRRRGQGRRRHSGGKTRVDHPSRRKAMIGSPLPSSSSAAILRLPWSGSS